MEEKVFDLKILNLKKAHLGKAVLWGVLALLAAAALYPVFFLVSGSFMGKDELGDCLGAVVSGKEGYADFPLLPGFPTLSHYVEVFLELSCREFFPPFRCSLCTAFFRRYRTVCWNRQDWTGPGSGSFFSILRCP